MPPTDIIESMKPAAPPSPAETKLRRIRQVHAEGYQTLVRTAKGLWNEVWADGAMKPPAVAEAMGTAGKSAFDRIEKLAALIASEAPTGYTPPPLGVPAGFTVSFPAGADGQPDGTVVITAPPVPKA